MRFKLRSFSKGLILTLIILSLVFSTSCFGRYDDKIPQPVHQPSQPSSINYQELESQIEIESVMTDMNALLDLSPRVTSTNNEEAAGEYIANKFSEFGLEVETEEFISQRIQSGTGESQNIIGVKKANRNNAKTLIIGAHYDTVACPGANDNTSGTVVLLEVAKILSTKSFDFNIKFIAFGAEEVGLEGSKYHVKTNYPTVKERSDVIGMINLDMVGMGTYMNIYRESPNSSDAIYNLAVNAAKSINLPYTSSFFGRSDHVPFESAGIPVVFFLYGPFPEGYYHNEKDNISIIDQECLSNSIKLVLKLVSTIDPNL